MTKYTYIFKVSYVDVVNYNYSDDGFNYNCGKIENNNSRIFSVVAESKKYAESFVYNYFKEKHNFKIEAIETLPLYAIIQSESLLKILEE